MKHNILLVGDSVADTLDPLVIELISFAKNYLEMAEGKMTLVAPGPMMSAQLTDITATYGVNVIHLHGDPSQYRNPEILAEEIGDLMDEVAPSLVCFLHTTRGCQLAAYTAVQAGCACVTAVEAIKGTPERLRLERGLFNGKFVAEMSAQGDVAVVTILPGAFSAECGGSGAIGPGEIVTRPIEHTAAASRYIDITQAFGADKDLEEADVIVSGGRGIGSEDNVALIRELASIFPKAAVGGSKPVCDLKWLPYSRQVGATGRIVSPRLYIACGISGAQQHVIGMKHAQWTIAINSDPEAVIFSHADIGIVEDLTTFIPLVVEQFRNR